MKSIIAFLFSAIIFTGCTFGNESSEGAVFGDYIFSIVIAISGVIGVANLIMYWYAKEVRGIKDKRKQIWAFVGLIIALGFFLIAKYS